MSAEERPTPYYSDGGRAVGSEVAALHRLQHPVEQLGRLSAVVPVHGANVAATTVEGRGSRRHATGVPQLLRSAAGDRL